MAAIEDLIKQIAEPGLRDQLDAEVARLKATKKFGLVFEEHLPEIVRLPNLKARVGARVLKNEDAANVPYRVVAAMDGNNVKIVPESGGPLETVASESLVVAKAFGEPMYPALIPVDTVEHAPGKPWHVLINADNYHALQMLLYGYEGKVDVIDIDPPYNTGARDWKYNNNYVDKTDQYRHSKWLSMMKKRLILSKRLLNADGVLIVTIDEHEFHHLALLLDQVLPEYDKQAATVVINPGGTTRLHNPQGNEGAPMSRILLATVFLFLALSVGFGHAADSPVIAPDARLEKLIDGFKFTEGPAADGDGNVFFTDQPNDRILKWSTDGKLSTFLRPCGRANGLCFDVKGNLWACADEKNELWRIDPKGKVTVVVEDYQGKLLNGPNDLWIHPNGGIYLTDPFYKRDYWKRGEKEQDKEAVYYLASDYKTLTRVADDLKQPNGIIGTPDGKTLYVADIKAGRTYAYDITSDVMLKNKRLFCEMGSDGMTLDSGGNVYLTGKGVTVFDKAGKKIEQIAVPEPWTANVCFGGKDRKTLFITASTGLYGLKMRVKGVGSQ